MVLLLFVVCYLQGHVSLSPWLTIERNLCAYYSITKKPQATSESESTKPLFSWHASGVLCWSLESMAIPLTTCYVRIQVIVHSCVCVCVGAPVKADETHNGTELARQHPTHVWLCLSCLRPLPKHYSIDRRCTYKQGYIYCRKKQRWI